MPEAQFHYLDVVDTMTGVRSKITVIGPVDNPTSPVYCQATGRRLYPMGPGVWRDPLSGVQVDAAPPPRDGASART